MQQWHDEGQSIRLYKNGKVYERFGFNIESSASFQREYSLQRFPGLDRNLEHAAEPPNGVIDHLIVTTEGSITVSALSSIKQRLRQSSTICFIQDGLGIIEKVNASVFKNPPQRPNYILGNISHVLQSNETKFTVIQKSAGTMLLTMLPRLQTVPGTISRADAQPVTMYDHGWKSSSKFVMRTLSRAPELNAKGFGMMGYFKAQLERLAVNAVLGPMSVVFDCSNDQLLYNYQASRTMKLLLTEISLIIRSLPEAQGLPKIDKLFSAERLEKLVLSVIGRTGGNVSRMLQAVRAGQKTDIDYYNGYLLMRATELGIDCPRNEMIVFMVEAKQRIKSRMQNSDIPFRDFD